MLPGEPILIICHGFPPVFGIGGRRWAKFAKELARRGHPVHVIRSIGPKHGTPSLWTTDVQHPNIVAHPLPQRYPSVLMKQPLDRFLDKVMYRVWLRLLPLLVKGNWYDRAIFWRKQLLQAAEALIAKQGIRNVIVSGAPFSLLTYASGLKHRFPEVNLVADLRDPWTWGSHYGHSSIGPGRMDRERANEALVAITFDKLIAPSASVIDHMQRLHGGGTERYILLPHTIDPDECAPLAGTKVWDGLFRMIYAGSLYDRGETDRYFEELFRAFLRMRCELPSIFRDCRLDLYITGQGANELRHKAHEQGLQNTIHFHDPVAPKEVLRQIAAADLVIAFTSTDKKDIMVTKFNEIFYLRRPVLHIGEPGLVSRTIIERRLGASLRVDELVTELPRIISRERKIDIDMEADHSDYLLGPITDRLIREVLI